MVRWSSVISHCMSSCNLSVASQRREGTSLLYYTWTSFPINLAVWADKCSIWQHRMQRSFISNIYKMFATSLKSLFPFVSVLEASFHHTCIGWLLHCDWLPCWSECNKILLVKLRYKVPPVQLMDVKNSVHATVSTVMLKHPCEVTMSKIDF